MAQTADGDDPGRNARPEASACKKTERLLTGMLISADETKRFAISYNNIYTDTGDFFARVDRSGLMVKEDGTAITINSQFRDWQFIGKSHSKDGTGEQDRRFPISTLICNGVIFNQQGEGKLPRQFDVELGAVVEPETGVQVAIIKPPLDCDGRLDGGELTLLGEDGILVSMPLSGFENSVFDVKIVGETVVDGKQITGICKGTQANGKEEFFNLRGAYHQANAAKAEARKQIAEIKASASYQAYSDLNRSLTEGNHDEEARTRLLQSQRHFFLKMSARRAEDKMRPWLAVEAQATLIEEQYRHFISNPVVDSAVLRRWEQSSQKLRETLLGSPLKVLKDKLDQDSLHPELEKLPRDGRRISGNVDIGGDRFTMQQGTLIDQKGEEIATINPSNNALIVKGRASVKDGKLVIEKHQSTSEQQEGENDSVVPIGLLTGAKWKLQWEDDTDHQKRSVSWISLGPEHKNYIASLAFVMVSSYGECRYADAVYRAGKTEETERILANTKARQIEFEVRVVDIFTSSQGTSEDVAYIAEGASQHVREVDWQAPESVSDASIELAIEEESIARIESVRPRSGDEIDGIDQGLNLTVNVEDKKKTLGQFLLGHNIPSSSDPGTVKTSTSASAKSDTPASASGDTAAPGSAGVPPAVRGDGSEEPPWRTVRNTIKSFEDLVKQANVTGDSKRNPIVEDILKEARDQKGLDAATKKQLSDLYDQYASYKEGDDPRSVIFVNAVAAEALRGSGRTQRAAQFRACETAAKPPVAPVETESAAEKLVVAVGETESTAAKSAADTGAKVSTAEALAELAKLISADPTLKREKSPDIGEDPEQLNPWVAPFLKAAAERVRQRSNYLSQTAEQLTKIGCAYAAGDPSIRKEVNEAIATWGGRNDSEDSAVSAGDKTAVSPVPVCQEAMPAAPVPVVTEGCETAERGAGRIDLGADPAKASSGDSAERVQGVPIDAVTRKLTASEMFSEKLENERNKDNYEKDIARLVTFPKEQNLAVYHLLGLAPKHSQFGKQLRTMQEAYKNGAPAVVEEANILVLELLNSSKH